MQVRKQLACKYCGLQVLKIKELLDHVAEIHPETRQNVPTAEPTLADLQGTSWQSEQNNLALLRMYILIFADILDPMCS